MTIRYSSSSSKLVTWRLKDNQAQCESLEFIMGNNILNIVTPVSPVISSIARSTSLAIQKFPTTNNPPPALDEKVVGEWCMKVKFEMIKYFDE